MNHNYIRFYLTIKLVVFYLILQTPDLFSQLSAEKIYERNSPAVVLINTYDEYGKALSTGSGCQLNEEGLIVTNYHVIIGAYSADLIFSDQTKYKVKYVYAFDKVYDLALLKHFGKKKDHVIIAASDNVKVGEVCYAIGSPKGIQNTLSNGLISNIHKYENGYVLQISNPISPGSSGGGLFNENGYLIGITYATLKDGQNINFAIPSEYLTELMEKSFTQTTLSEFQVMIGGSAVLYPKIDENNKKKDSPPEQKDENEQMEIDETDNFDFDRGYSYDLGGRYIFMSSALNKEVPSYVEFKKGFSATFSYWFSKYGGLGITYQKHDVINKNTGTKINLRLYKGEFMIRTSEHPLRMLMGFGIGLANSDFQNGEDDAEIVIGTSVNQFTASANLGIEYMIMNRVSISVSSPVDYILVNDTKGLGVIFFSPSMGFNVVF